MNVVSDIDTITRTFFPVKIANGAVSEKVFDLLANRVWPNDATGLE